MLCMKKTIDAVRAIDPNARVIVGGAPVTQEFADRIGASGYARTPSPPSTAFKPCCDNRFLVPNGWRSFTSV